MALTGKCIVCEVWLELTGTGHLPTHKPKGEPKAEKPCAGSGSVPVKRAKAAPAAGETEPAQEE